MQLFSSCVVQQQSCPLYSQRLCIVRLAAFGGACLSGTRFNSMSWDCYPFDSVVLGPTHENHFVSHSSQPHYTVVFITALYSCITRIALLPPSCIARGHMMTQCTCVFVRLVCGLGNTSLEPAWNGYAFDGIRSLLGSTTF